MSDDIVTLRAELVRNADEFRETLTELRQRLETLTAERDEARREICVMLEDATNNHRENHAKTWGWDCFPREDGK